MFCRYEKFDLLWQERKLPGGSEEQTGFVDSSSVQPRFIDPAGRLERHAGGWREDWEGVVGWNRTRN